MNAWDHAVPIGNGHLGAMVFGGITHERVQLSESTMWSGGVRDCTNPEALSNLPEVRKLLFAKKPVEAIHLADDKLMGSPKSLTPYQPQGDLWLDFDHRDDQAEAYRRELDLDGACARVSYRVDGVNYLREAFASAPVNVLAVRMTYRFHILLITNGGV